jgi:putative ribosome biogenesis GTPase RsgA
MALVGDTDQRGRETTTRRELYRIPGAAVLTAASLKMLQAEAAYQIRQNGARAHRPTPQNARQ